MCSIFADGDGAFRPKVSFEYPEELPDVLEINGRVDYNRETKKYNRNYISGEGDFIIDPDLIAWTVFHDSEPEYIRKKNPQEDAIKETK